MITKFIVHLLLLLLLLLKQIHIIQWHLTDFFSSSFYVIGPYWERKKILEMMMIDPNHVWHPPTTTFTILNIRIHWEFFFFDLNNKNNLDSMELTSTICLLFLHCLAIWLIDLTFFSIYCQSDCAASVCVYVCVSIFVFISFHDSCCQLLYFWFGCFSLCSN